MRTTRYRFTPLLGLALGLLGASTVACVDTDELEFEADPEALGLGDADELDELCPPLPDGVELIPGLGTASAYTRFGGLVMTLSTRSLACEETAFMDATDGEGHGLTLGLPAELANVGLHPFDHEMYVEYEMPDSGGVPGPFDSAEVELFEITDTCVTGRVRGLVDSGGPFDGGFRALRCTP